MPETGVLKYMKFAITADLHFQAKRLDDIRKGWEELINHLVGNKTPYLLVGGDLFSNYNIAGREASLGTVYSALAEPLRKYKQAGGYVYAIPGNHDIAGQNQRDALVALEELITVVREPKGVVLAQTGEKINIQFLPWLYNNTTPHDQLIPKAKPEYFNILLGHCEVSGTQVTNHYTIPVGGHFELPREAFAGKGYNYVALGHIHKRVGLYVGSPWQLTFGEEGNRPGFVVLDIKNGKAKETWVDLVSTPQYYTYNADNGSNIKLVPGKEGVDYIKIKYTGEPPQIDLGDNVTLEKIPTQGTARARTGVSTSSTFKEMLAAWMKENAATEFSIEELLCVAGGDNPNHTNTTGRVGSIEYIESVRLNHIGPHTDTHINFENNKYIAISGHNGSGKTFIVDSIFAAFFGGFPSRKGSLFDHISQGYDGTSSIEVVFRSHGRRYAALRRINNKRRHEAALTDTTTNKIIAGPKVSDFDREITALVGTEDIVLASIFSAQKGVGDIVDADPSTRKEVLGQILNIGFLTAVSENARQKAVELNARVDAGQRRASEIDPKTIASQIELTKTEISNLVSYLVKLDNESVSLAHKLKQITEEGQRLSAALSKTEEARKTVVALKQEIASTEKEMSSLQKQLSTTRNVVVSEVIVNEKLKEIGAAKSEYKSLLTKYEENLKATAKLATISGEITVEKSKIDQEKDRIENEAKSLVQEKKTVSAECGNLIESYLSIIKLHTDNQKNLRSAGCSKQPIPCPFINDAIASGKKAVEVQAQIDQTKEAYQRKRNDLEQNIQGLSKILEQDKYAKDARIRLAELEKEKKKVVLVAIPEDRLLRLKSLVESEGATLSELQRIKSGKEFLIDLESRYTATHKKYLDKKSNEVELACEIDKDKDASARYNELKKLWADTSKLRDETQKKITDTSASKAILSERIKQYERDLSELAALNQSLATDYRNYKIYETVARAFGKNGIPQLLIDSALPQIQDIHNNLLAQLDNKFTIRFSTQQETQDGKIREALDIIAGDSLGERDVGNFSGGEQKLLKSIIRIAIAVFQAQRSGGKYEILIIDEVFDALDRDNALRVLQILSSLQDQFKQIIVVSHTDDLLFEFPVRINLQKTHRGSIFTLVAA